METNSKPNRGERSPRAKGGLETFGRTYPLVEDCPSPMVDMVGGTTSVPMKLSKGEATDSREAVKVNKGNPTSSTVGDLGTLPLLHQQPQLSPQNRIRTVRLITQQSRSYRLTSKQSSLFTENTDVKQKTDEKCLPQLEGDLVIDLSPFVRANGEAKRASVEDTALINCALSFTGKENQVIKVATTSAPRNIGGARTNKQANSSKKSVASPNKGKGQHKEVARIMCRLDRILVNSHFVNVFPHSVVNYLAPGISDHSPLKVVFVPVFPTGPKPFKCIEMWETRPSFKVTVEAVWNSEVKDSPLYRLVKKLSVTKLALKQWNKDCFELVQHKLQKTRDDLSAV
ncbi:hypothetical protein QJS10_CPA01g02057 [Acorus calamus]|uniref:Uncharacterized protein n=1 Tax=Acorus calamus TaxID=4465 RepID=A0AAV9FFU5_ACOCL|nr:hypothetical protein QJS10_CPA01g02057 [Acorus calamus]